MGSYHPQNKELMASIRRNKNHTNHLIAAADDMLDGGRSDEAISLYRLSQSDAVMIQLQRMYHSPAYERRCHGQFVDITDQLDAPVKVAKEKQHAGDETGE